MIREYTKEQAYEILEGDLISDKPVSEHRWYWVHAAVFKGDDGKLWQIKYNVGKSELQEDIPAFYDEVIKAVQVEPFKIVVTEYRVVENG